MADIILGIAVTTLISMYGSFITAPNAVAVGFFSEHVPIKIFASYFCF